MAVAGRPIDGDSAFHKALTSGVDVVDAKGEMAEVSPARVFLRVPVVGEFQERRLLHLGPIFVLGRRQEI